MPSGAENRLSISIWLRDSRVGNWCRFFAPQSTSVAKTKHEKKSWIRLRRNAINLPFRILFIPVPSHPSSMPPILSGRWRRRCVCVWMVSLFLFLNQMVARSKQQPVFPFEYNVNRRRFPGGLRNERTKNGLSIFQLRAGYGYFSRRVEILVSLFAFPGDALIRIWFRYLWSKEFGEAIFGRGWMSECSASVLGSTSDVFIRVRGGGGVVNLCEWRIVDSIFTSGDCFSMDIWKSED